MLNDLQTHTHATNTVLKWQRITALFSFFLSFKNTFFPKVRVFVLWSVEVPARPKQFVFPSLCFLFSVSLSLGQLPPCNRPQGAQVTKHFLKSAEAHPAKRRPPRFRHAPLTQSRDGVVQSKPEPAREPEHFRTERHLRTGPFIARKQT